MTDYIIEELKRLNIEKVSNDKKNEINTNYLYNIIWKNTIYLYKTNKRKKDYIMTWYEILDSNNKRILPKHNKSYYDTLKSISKKKQLFIHFSDLSEENRKDYILPISVDSLFDKLKNDGFIIANHDLGNLVIAMETTKFEDLVNKASQDELNIKARKK